MRWFTEFAIFACFLVLCKSAPRDPKKKSIESIKKAVETYAYTVPSVRHDEKGDKSKVVVETIKSISPSDYLTPTGYTGTTFEASTPNEKIPIGSVTFNAFEADPTKKETTITSVPTETATIIKNKPTFRYFPGIQKNIGQSALDSATIPPALIRTTSLEPDATLLPNYQLTSRLSSVSGDILNADKPLKIITTRGKIGNGRYTVQKIVKKATKIEPKHSDSKPEETGINGYHYELGTLNFESKHSGSQGGTMGASYMRSSSPFYNFHVMLD